MAKLVLSDITSFLNSSIVTINDNWAAIEAAIENTISRDGTSPNVMLANFDMNSFRIINLPSPQAGTDPARFIDVQNASSIALAPSQTGNSGKVLTTDGSIASWSTLAPLLGTELSAAADKLPYFSGASALSLTTFTSFARTLLDDANGDAVWDTLELSISDFNLVVQDIVDGLTAETSPAIDDVVIISDVSLTPDRGRKMTLENMLKVVGGLTVDANPVGSTDFALTYDASASAAKKVLLDQLPLPFGYIGGLVMSSAADTDHDITISAGACSDATGVFSLRLSAALTKQIDAAWAVGTNAGGLDTGVVGNNTWYYIWLIRRSDTGVVDALFSTSSSSPTMPTNYDQKRLVALARTDGSANILAFSAVETAGGGLNVMWADPPLDVDLANTLTTTARLDTLSVPPLTGVVVNANFFVLDSSSAGQVYISNPRANDEATSDTAGPLATLLFLTTSATRANLYVGTVSGQIRSRANLATVDTYRIATLGYEWSRR